MPGRRFIVQVRGRAAATDLAGVDHAHGRVTLHTVLRVTVRDQAALQGLLRRIHDLGLNLVEVQEVRGPREAQAVEQGFDVTVDGAVGDLVESALVDYIGPIRLSSRYSVANAVVMGEVLSRLLDRGADLEHAIEQADASDVTADRR